MLSGHPYIERAYLPEFYSDNGKLLQKLIVETRLKDPRRNKGKGDMAAWQSLENYLANLATNDFADFSSVEIKEFADTAG